MNLWKLTNIWTYHWLNKTYVGSVQLGKALSPVSSGSLKSPKKILSLKKILCLEEFRSEPIFGWKTFGSESILKKILCLKKFLVRKKFRSEEVLSKNILVHKHHDPKKIGSKKFGQNWTSKKLRYCIYE